jgi:hypothetical protein
MIAALKITDNKTLLKKYENSVGMRLEATTA